MHLTKDSKLSVNYTIAVAQEYSASSFVAAKIESIVVLFGNWVSSSNLRWQYVSYSKWTIVQLIIDAASNGYWPDADSADNIVASAPL